MGVYVKYFQMPKENFNEYYNLIRAFKEESDSVEKEYIDAKMHDLREENLLISYSIKDFIFENILMLILNEKKICYEELTGYAALFLKGN